MAPRVCNRRSIVGALGFGLFGGAMGRSRSSESVASTSHASREHPRIGIVAADAALLTQHGGIDAGIALARARCTCECDVAIASESRDQMSALAWYAATSDLTIAVGRCLVDSVTAISRTRGAQPFAVIDGYVPQFNVRSYTFRVEEGCYLTGVIAGRRTQTGAVFVNANNLVNTGALLTEFAAGLLSAQPEAAIAYSDSPVADLMFVPGGGDDHATLLQRRERGDEERVTLGETRCRYDIALLDAIAAVAAGAFTGCHIDLGLSEGAVVFVEPA